MSFFGLLYIFFIGMYRNYYQRHLQKAVNLTANIHRGQVYKFPHIVLNCNYYIILAELNAQHNMKITFHLSVLFCELMECSLAHTQLDMSTSNDGTCILENGQLTQGHIHVC
ncbi:hypothetical protein ACJX0J_038035 [Zea mays]